MPNYFLIGGKKVTIPIDELGSDCITESIQEDGNATATVMMQCAWADRYAVYRTLKGTSVAIGRSIVRTIPFAYPNSPNLYCLSIGDSTGIKPYRDATGWIQFQVVRFSVFFGRPRYDFNPNDPAGQNDPSGKPWTTTKFKTSAEIIAPPKGSYYVGPFPSTKKAEEGTVGIIAPNCEISMTRHFLPFVPLDEIMTASSFTNLYPIQFANRTFDKGQLLFISADTNPNNDPDGNFTQEITYTLMGKNSDWNRFIADDGSLQLLNTKADGTGKLVYGYLDFSLYLP